MSHKGGERMGGEECEVMDGGEAFLKNSTERPGVKQEWIERKTEERGKYGNANILNFKW